MPETPIRNTHKGTVVKRLTSNGASFKTGYLYQNHEIKKFEYPESGTIEHSANHIRNTHKGTTVKRFISNAASKLKRSGANRHSARHQYNWKKIKRFFKRFWKWLNRFGRSIKRAPK